jgi:sterol 3beta-glucosyltransferase
MVALAKALKSRHHVVAICAPTGFRPMLDRHGIDYAHMDNAVLELTEAVLRAPSHREQIRLFKGFGTIVRGTMQDEWRAARDLRPDVLVYHSKALGCHHIAEKLGIAEFLAMPLPLTPTEAFPVPIIPDPGLGSWFNRSSYRLLSVANAIWAKATNDFRVQTLGLRALSRWADANHRADGTPVPALYAFSEHVLRRPTDWPDHAHVTGCWFLDEGDQWEAPLELRRFLDDGVPPLYVGFGSVGGAEAHARTAAVVKAVSLLRLRAVLVSGWGGLNASSSTRDICALAAAPHDWLFPRMSAVVHHGGAGSTMAGLRAGKATVICPFFGDQPFWGRTVHRAGVGSQPLPRRVITAERLAEAIREALDPEVRARAEVIGQRIRAEDGTGRAVALIEKEVSAWS